MQGQSGTTTGNKQRLPLTATQIDVCARVWFDRMQPSAVAEERGCTVDSVKQVLAAAKRRLADAGLPVPKRTRKGRIPLFQLSACSGVQL